MCLCCCVGTHICVCVSCCFLLLSTIHDTVFVWQPPKRCEKHKHRVNRNFAGGLWVSIYSCTPLYFVLHLSIYIALFSLCISNFPHFAHIVKVTGILCLLLKAWLRSCHFQQHNTVSLYVLLIEHTLAFGVSLYVTPPATGWRQLLLSDKFTNQQTAHFC